MNRDEQFDLLLSRLSRSPGVIPVDDPCPAPEVFWDAISGALSLEEVLSLSEHATRCPVCREAWVLTREMYRQANASDSSVVGAELESVVAESSTLRDMSAGIASYSLADWEPEGGIHMMGTPSAGQEPSTPRPKATLHAFSKSTLQGSPKWMAVAAGLAVIVGLGLDEPFSPSSTERASDSTAPVWRSLDHGKRWGKGTQQRSQLCWEPLGPEFHYHVVLLDADLQIILERFAGQETCLDLQSEPIGEHKAKQARYWRIKAQAETGLEVHSPSTELRADWHGVERLR